MKLLVTRKPAHDDAIIGDLFIDGVWQCFTLERHGVEIPAGTYPVVITPSFRFGRLLPLIDRVPGRMGIRIHPLNFTQETDGCIGVGQDHRVESIERSALAMQALQPKIAYALANGEHVSLTVMNAPVEALRA